LAEIREVSPGGERRKGREHALQILYQMDLSPSPIDECLEGFWGGRQSRAGMKAFAEKLVRGVMERREWLDGVLGGISHHWRLPRMAVVDRNVLRLALFEMIFEPATPRIVVINEAIDIAKKFGDDESGPFINGILDAVRLRLERNEIPRPDDESGGSEPPLRSSA
jgi:N utilization substance protein B